MPRAWSLLRAQPWYRSEAFSRGLKATGYEVYPTAAAGRRGDVLLIWHRYGGNHDIANRFEREGGTVICAENGYIGHGGIVPKYSVHPGGPKPDDHYAISLGFHNDEARWTAGGPERFAALGVEVKPWRTAGEHVLVLPNRSFGVPGRMMPAEWPRTCQERLQRVTKRPVRVRVHPGNDAPKRPLSADLENCWAAVVWSSSAGVHALAAGIPVFCEAPYWSMKSAASSGSPDAPTLPDRLPAFERLAWGQWEIREIETGEPFRVLLNNTRQHETTGDNGGQQKVVNGSEW